MDNFQFGIERSGRTNPFGRSDLLGFEPAHDFYRCWGNFDRLIQVAGVAYDSAEAWGKEILHLAEFLTTIYA